MKGAVIGTILKAIFRKIFTKTRRFTFAKSDDTEHHRRSARGMQLANAHYICSDQLTTCDANASLGCRSDVLQCLVTVVEVMSNEEFVDAVDSSGNLLEIVGFVPRFQYFRGSQM